MSKSTRLRALLATGYFPEELPPPFNTQGLARYRQSIGTAWAAVPGDYPRSAPEMYSGPRQRGWRRDFAIVNPVAQYHLAKLIAENWTEIAKHLSASYGAETLTISQDGPRAVSKPDFELVRLRHLEVTAQYDYVLVADISRFYGTLYTHAIPWALDTKKWCKANLRSRDYYASLGHQLDRSVRRGNEDQTLGIPVGPDTSRVLSEIVAVAVDGLLRRQLGLSADRVVRHVDDWFIGFDTLGEAEAAMSVLSAACRDFQLEIHPEKTRCVHVPSETAQPWPMALRSITLTGTGAAQRGSIEHFFSEAFHFAKVYPTDNVMGYAVRRSRAMKVQAENWHTYETYLLKAARANTTTLPGVVQIFTSYNASRYPLGRQRIAKLIDDLIRTGAPKAFHAEVAWALFLAKALSIRLPATSLAPVSQLESSVCALIALDLRSRDLIDGQLDTSLWQQSMNSAGLTSNMWLLAYEAELKGWLTGAAQYVQADPYFAELRGRGVSFYDTKRNVRHIRKAKPKAVSGALASLLAKWAAPRDQGAPAAADDVQPGLGPLFGLGGYWD